MNEQLFIRALKALEFDKIQDKLAEYAISPGAKDMARKLIPLFDLDTIKEEQAKTSAAKYLSQVKGFPSFSDLKDISSALDRANLGSVLSMRELLDVASVLKTVRHLKEYRGENDKLVTVLDMYFNSVSVNKYLEEKIFASIISEEEMADNASSELYDIRRKIRQAESRIRETLNKLIHSPAFSKFLQDPIITVRDGRFVVPVKAEHRGEISGIMHDMSSSGATVFIEPMGVVEANNDSRLLKAKEQKEIERILFALSSEVSTFSESIKNDYDKAVTLDFIYAKAKLSDKLRAMEPRLNNTGNLRFNKARHPLLDMQKAVPIDIELGFKHDVLVITGPNTGGKTVSLKTTGLLTLMAQSGLHIPVTDDSEAAVFQNIFADIGDEQSIEQSLSTFSAHMKNIVGILDNADNESLVLFDELGAGTDPVEGAALATSILEYIRSIGAKAVATTHYSELKIYALETERVENASCEFDIESLKPTYRLITGIPGRSNAFAIASRLGLAENIINKANVYLSQESVKFEKVIADLEKNRISLENDRDIAAKARIEAEKLKREADELKANIQRNADKEIERAKSEARRVIEGAKVQISELMDELEELRKQKDSADFKEKLNEMKVKAKTSVKKIEDEADPVKAYEDSYVLPRQLKIGDTVKLLGINKTATVLSLPDNNGYVSVRAGIITTKVKQSELRLTENYSPKKEVARYTSRFEEGKKNTAVKNEIDMRGMTTSEALIDLDNFIDNSIMAGLPSITIIHGKGTGALRTAVHQHLRKHPGIRSFRLGVYGEGEMGVTIAELK